MVMKTETSNFCATLYHYSIFGCSLPETRLGLFQKEFLNWLFHFEKDTINILLFLKRIKTPHLKHQNLLLHGKLKNRENSRVGYSSYCCTGVRRLSTVQVFCAVSMSNGGVILGFDLIRNVLVGKVLKSMSTHGSQRSVLRIKNV